MIRDWPLLASAIPTNNNNNIMMMIINPITNDVYEIFLSKIILPHISKKEQINKKDSSSALKL